MHLTQETEKIGIMVPGLYLKYAFFEFLMSTYVKFDPPLITGL